MFNSMSKAGTGAYALGVWALISLLGYFGLSITEAQAVEVVTHLVGLYGLVMSIVGTWDRPDLDKGLWRK